MSRLTGYYLRGNIFICHHLSQYCCKEHLIRLMNHQTPLVWINGKPVKYADIIFHGAKKRNSADRTAVFSLYLKKKKNSQKEQQSLLSRLNPIVIWLHFPWPPTTRLQKTAVPPCVVLGVHITPKARISVVLLYAYRMVFLSFIY